MSRVLDQGTNSVGTTKSTVGPLKHMAPGKAFCSQSYRHREPDFEDILKSI